MDEVSKEKFKNIEKDIEELKDLPLIVNDLVNNVANLTKNVDSLTTKVSNIESKPLRTFEKVSIGAISACCSAIAVSIVVALVQLAFKK